MKIFVQTLFDTSIFTAGTIITVEDVDTLIHVKKEIEAATGVPAAQQSFKFDGKLLDDATPLAHYNIDNKSIIYVSLCGGKGFQIFLRNLKGKTITIDDNHSWDTIEHVMHKIEEKDHVPFAEQCVVYAGKILNAMKTLADYDIKKESTLHLVNRYRSYGDVEKTFERLGDPWNTGKLGKLILPVNTSDTLELVKKRIGNMFYLPRHRLWIIFNRSYLVDDARTLADYGICLGSILYLTLSPPPWLRKRKRESDVEESNKMVWKKIHLICAITDERERLLDGWGQFIYKRHAIL